MKSPIILLSLALCLNASAASMTVTPNVVSNNYDGLISFQMTGLPTGATVQVVQYYDFNGNGIIDGPDLPVRGETISDGQLALVDGATNINVMRDEDGVANGVIQSSYRFAFAPDVACGVGQYVFRLSSPSGDFPAVSAPFTIVNAPYAQKVVGAVVNNGTNVPHAGVALVQVVSGPSIKVVVGGAADASGNYVLKAPPGSYMVIPFWPGFVADFKATPSIVLASNATVTTNLSLIAGTTTLSGRLKDYDNPPQPALPYSQITVIGTNLQFVVAMTDSNANYNVPITPGVWTVRARWKSAISKSYLIPDPLPIEDEAHFNTLAGPDTGADITLKHATALIYGSVLDSQSNGIAAINLSANGDGGRFDGIALSDSNGLYSLAMDSGGGFVEVQNLSEPPASAYLWTGTYFGVDDGEALDLNIIGHIATAHMRWQILDDSGAPLTNLFGFANGNSASSLGNTDANGVLDLPVFGGVWDLHLEAIYTNLVLPDVPPVTITDGVDFAGQIIARKVTGQISGYLHGMNNVAITGVAITATNSVGATNFTLTTDTDSSGNYAIPAFNGTWNVSVTSYIQGYATPAPTNVTLPPANAIANFDLPSIPPPQITLTSLPSGTISNFYEVPLTATNGSGILVWSVIDGSLPGGLRVQFFGTESDLIGAPTNSGLFTFTLEVTDSRGSNDMRILSLNVSAGPLTIATPASLQTADGCSLNNQLQATGGSPPYLWTLAPGSTPLPDGVQLATNGLLFGPPTSDGYFSPTVQVGDSTGATATEMLSISVGSPLTVSSQPLPDGEVGITYYGYPPVSGGAQPQTWLLVSNSLPPNYNLDAGTGIITGMPTNAGVYNFTLRASDGCVTADLVLSITNVAPVQIAATTLPAAPLNVPYNAQLQASEGASPFYWYTSDFLPNGLTLNSDGSLTGTPDLPGTNTFLAQVYDGAGGSATRSFTIAVTTQPILDLPSRSVPGQFTFRITGVPNQSYTLQFATNLSNWVDLLTTNAPANTFFLTDPNASNNSRFYKLRVNP